MTTPIRRQYLSIKAEHNDALLLFRMGDFYETFDNDAEVISKDLDIALTSREMGKDNRVPLAGIPYHALDSYLAKLINKGHKIAICEQISDSETSSVKGLMDREVVRVITPGTIIEPSILNDKKNNYIVSLIIENDIATVAYIDTSSSNSIDDLFAFFLYHLLSLSSGELYASFLENFLYTSVQVRATKDVLQSIRCWSISSLHIRPD